MSSQEKQFSTKLKKTFGSNRADSRTMRRYVLFAVLALAPLSLAVTASSEALREQVAIPPATTLEGRIIERLYDKLSIGRDEFRFAVHRKAFTESDWENPQDIDSLTVRPLLSSQPKGLYPIVVKIFRADGTTARGQVTLYATQYQKVLVLTQDVRRGGMLSEDAVTSETRDITQLIEQPIGDLSYTANMRFRRNARKGSVVTQKMFEAIPDVVVGDEVVINYRKGALFLTANGKALGKGVVGEKIRVQNLSSRKVLTATITSAGVVSLGRVSGRRRAAQ